MFIPFSVKKISISIDDLFDTYMANFINLQEKKRKEEEIKMKGKATERKKIEKYGDSLSRPSLLKALKLLERQIMQIPLMEYSIMIDSI